MGWTYAGEIEGQKEPTIISMLGWPGPYAQYHASNGQPHWITEMMVTRKEPFNAERLLLSTGITNHYMESNWENGRYAAVGRRIETPVMNISYHSTRGPMFETGRAAAEHPIHTGLRKIGSANRGQAMTSLNYSNQPMKRRDLIKSLTFLPAAGRVLSMHSPQPVLPPDAPSAPPQNRAMPALHRQAFVMDGHTHVMTRELLMNTDIGQRYPDGNVDLPQSEGRRRRRDVLLGVYAGELLSRPIRNQEHVPRSRSSRWIRSRRTAARSNWRSMRQTSNGSTRAERSRPSWIWKVAMTCMGTYTCCAPCTGLACAPCS